LTAHDLVPLLVDFLPKKLTHVGVESHLVACNFANSVLVLLRDKLGLAIRRLCMFNLNSIWLLLLLSICACTVVWVGV